MLALLCGGAAGAQETKWQKNHPRRTEVNKRLNNQNRRIQQGVKSGELNKGQAKQLHQEDKSIRKQERQDAAANGGHITKQQQRQPEPAGKPGEQADLPGKAPRRAMRGHGRVKVYSPDGRVILSCFTCPSSITNSKVRSEKPRVRKRNPLSGTRFVSRLAWGGEHQAGTGPGQDLDAVSGGRLVGSHQLPGQVGVERRGPPDEHHLVPVQAEDGPIDIALGVGLEVH